MLKMCSVCSTKDAPARLALWAAARIWLLCVFCSVCIPEHREGMNMCIHSYGCVPKPTLVTLQNEIGCVPKPTLVTLQNSTRIDHLHDTLHRSQDVV